MKRSVHVVWVDQFGVTISDLFRIMDGMKVKGLEIETKNPIRFARNMPSLAVPMFMSVFQRSNTMMSVLTMRGYSFSNENRELRHDLKFDAGDALLFGTGVIVLGGTVAANFGVITVPILPSPTP